ncbi:class I SAM-dependent methyltransferase [Buttiauxella warmboldiae]|uniref:Class I SAM-dependent methyltransferase n=1 Tax=Buttiauxella warmboldiae TaxID=82993 RepID=A0A3N5E3A1_9ENTR|nr:class I SAM-dependent methyltransferase [Buttiauxella warmboldiae]
MTIDNQRLINSIIEQYMEMAHKQKEQYEKLMPKIKLEQSNIANCQLLLDRETLLENMPKNAVVAEIGVDSGAFSDKILRICTPSKLYLVDAWHTQRYHDGLFNQVTDKFREQLDSGCVEIKRGLSIEMASDFADQSLDWIYIDTDHSYETTIRELCLYAPKLKVGGIISGHDYTMGNFIKWYRYGVIEAVHQFCVTFGWELIFITAETIENQSFAIRKIS